ncbi:ligase-associated DNA damage response endonuclease PdeM [Maritimibacter sp. 55A14]|uniref:ligase-associated DNA damage response endonuclease PdeM n=1 Tax=Maritimibacter sp. 55A14 TaxID=2174844 RepID=UPI000D622CA5|nr:ligase-associated DNA damage response endonuclease PdeM [Maritimibacter sp. 55A14]PWE31975.1 ligase-associated DNA damage response endonuclease PdeM [Maritimibacter sp. 55A14]
MAGYDFILAGAALTALPSGALHWPEQATLVVSDLHLGKAERIARRGGTLLPPYETTETLNRLEADIEAVAAGCVLCLGDSFDDLEAAGGLPQDEADRLARLMAGHHWIWVEGNHDPGPTELGGTHLARVRLGPLSFRHIAQPGASAEVSGHYHPKARIAAGGRRIAARCFLLDAARLILPAYGAYTGGLHCDDPALSGLMGADARAVLLGDPPRPIPMPGAQSRPVSFRESR